jgi:hypothetical protein
MYKQLEKSPRKGLSFAETVRNDAGKKTDQICTEIVNAEVNALNAVDVAARLTAIEVEQAERLTTFYKAAVGTLSPATRSALETYVDTTVRPRLSWGHDLVGLAIEVPQAFLSLRREYCRRRLQTPANERAWQIGAVPQRVPPKAQQ